MVSILGDSCPPKTWRCGTPIWVTHYLLTSMILQMLGSVIRHPYGSSLNNSLVDLLGRNWTFRGNIGGSIPKKETVSSWFQRKGVSGGTARLWSLNFRAMLAINRQAGTYLYARLRLEELIPKNDDLFVKGDFSLKGCYLFWGIQFVRFRECKSMFLFQNVKYSWIF